MGQYDAQIREEYPQLAWMLGDPELNLVLNEAYEADRSGHPWTPLQLSARIEATNWWRNNSPSMRNYHEMANNDPAKFWQEVQRMADYITDLAAEWGMDLTTEQIYEAAKAALYFGRSDADIRRALVYGSGATISERSGVRSRVKSLANAYFIAMSPQDVDDWTRKIASGQYTEQNLAAQLQAWSKQMYPQFSRQLDSGMTMAAIAAPYRSRIASLMEISPDQVDMANDPRWRTVLNPTGPKGENVGRPMNDWEVDQYVRNQPEWRKTRAANDSGAELAELLSVEMGRKAA